MLSDGGEFVLIKTLSKLNIEKGYDVHYRYPIERIRKDYIDFLNSTFDINEIIDKAV